MICMATIPTVCAAAVARRRRSAATLPARCRRRDVAPAARSRASPDAAGWPGGVQAWRDPLVADTEPAAGSSGPVESVHAEFATAVTAVNPDAVITVVDAGGAPVAGGVAQEGKTFVFTPAEPLTPGDYTATAFNVQTDTPMGKPYQWSFTVAE